jgi:ferrous iron transport protein B
MNSGPKVPVTAVSCPRLGGRPSVETSPPLTLRAHPLKVALIGNPNVGKSALFGRLTGYYATVSNYPGTTVSVTRGRAIVGAEVCDVIDTPGVNSLEGTLSEDEQIARRVLWNDDVELVIQVADARNLRRALMITCQLARMGHPMVLALNMVDEARTHGVDIDANGLQAELGIPVIETVATEGRGLQQLRDALAAAAVPRVEPEQDAASWAHDVTGRFRRIHRRPVAAMQERIGRAVREPLTGVPILLLVLYLSYLVVGVFGAGTLVRILEGGLFDRFVTPGARHLADRVIPVPLLRDFLVGDYGFVSMGMNYALAIVLPITTMFFLVFGVLEDSGYVPRLAIFTDRIFRSMGLNGKAVLPMVLGLGCDTMATMTTRILGTPKERLIAIVLLALGIPCSAQLATIMGILGGISIWAVITLFGVVVTQMFLVGFLAARILPGERSDFMLELPPIRMPDARNLLKKTALRIRWYLGEAVPLFLIGTALLFVLDRTGLLALIVRFSSPVVTGMLGLPPESARVFVMGFLRRDYGAAGLFHLATSGQLTGVQAVVALTVMTLFIPCVANLLMIAKERGVKVAIGTVAFITPVAVLTGAALNHVLTLLRIAF